jgi:energy-coupling factor transporter ATP-binding protein EcfA2
MARPETAPNDPRSPPFPRGGERGQAGATVHAGTPIVAPVHLPIERPKPGIHHDADDWWRPAKGERALIVGQTGSGKTTFAAWLLERLPTAPCVIYDTKEENKFLTLPNCRVVHSFGDAVDATRDLSIDYVIFRPPVQSLAEPRLLDRYLMAHYEHLRGVDCYIDELYSFHIHGQAGPGLIAVYTRGRSRGITTVSSTQRPAWISKFSMSEANLVFVFWLQIQADRRNLADSTGVDELANPPRHHFWAYRTGAHAPPPALVHPIEHAAALAGYTDEPDPEPDTEIPPSAHVGHLWL